MHQDAFLVEEVEDAAHMLLESKIIARQIAPQWSA